MIFITGSTGFVGKNLIKSFKNKSEIQYYNRNDKIKINKRCNVVIHLAGKAHDLNKVKNPDEYYSSNYILTKKIFDSFRESNAKFFIMLSSIKAVKDNSNSLITEETKTSPLSHYGKSKLLAENYILNQEIPKDKKVYILRPTLIYGPSSKGNLNLLQNFIKIGLPWPLGLFENKKSFCSIENICFIINQLINNNKVISGIYNVCDDQYISTNQLIEIISNAQNKKIRILRIPKKLIMIIARIGDFVLLPLNSERLSKLTESYMVSNLKIKQSLGIDEMPFKAKKCLYKSFSSF
tara:strand:+ start:101 stop:982 length:882 start_codon:yes stop_codon:yes gene_type:complete